TSAAVKNVALKRLALGRSDGDPGRMPEHRPHTLKLVIDGDGYSRNECKDRGIGNRAFTVIRSRHIASQRHDGEPVAHVHLRGSNPDRPVLPGRVHKRRMTAANPYLFDLREGEVVVEQDASQPVERGVHARRVWIQLER